MQTAITALTERVRHSILRVEGRVLHVTLNRPGVLNALHPPAHFELAEIFDVFAADPELWIAVIGGAGARGFCTGTDLKVRAQLGRDDYPASGFGGLTRRFDLDKPVIAAVNGVALGGGLEIALACDLIIAAEHATFGFPEPRVGLAAMGGGVHRLVRQLPDKVAMGMLLTGRQITAHEALELRPCKPGRSGRAAGQRGGRMGGGYAGVRAAGSAGHQAGRAPQPRLCHAG